MKKSGTKTSVSPVDDKKVRKVKKQMKPEKIIHHLSETFKALSDPTRTKIIHALCVEKELCVNDIASATDSTSSAISHQLRILRNMKLVKYHKSGKTVYYSLDDEHVRNLFDEGLRHVEEL